MALGLATFALVSMMGLLTVGFKGARESINMGVVADIAQSIAGEAQLTPWTNLGIYNGTNRYYDDLGNEIGRDKASDAVYRVTTTLRPTSFVEAGNHATNLLIQINPVASPQTTNMAARILIKTE